MMNKKLLILVGVYLCGLVNGLIVPAQASRNYATWEIRTSRTAAGTTKLVGEGWEPYAVTFETTDGRIHDAIYNLGSRDLTLRGERVWHLRRHK